MHREFEAAMSRLIANPTALQLYRRDPDQVLRAYELTAEERGWLLAMEPQISELHAQFVARRKRRIRRPLARTLEVLGDYGALLLDRYVDLYPALKAASQEIERLGAFLLEALAAAPDRWELAADVLRVELALSHALRTLVPGEPGAPAVVAGVTEHSRLALAPGARFGLYAHDLVRIQLLTVAELRELAPAPTLLLSHRRSGTRDLVLLKLAPGAQAALELFDGRHTVAQIAELLARRSGQDAAATVTSLLRLAGQLAESAILIEPGRTP
jgi:hypothetical protein